MEGLAGTETLIANNHALLRRSEATWVYSALIIDATAETILMACAAQLRAPRLVRAWQQRRDGRPNAP
jgi:hypothetical protein